MQRLCWIVLLLIACGSAHANDAMRDCYESGTVLAQCAAAWERVFQAGNKATDATTAYQLGSYEGYVSGVADQGLGTSWCPATRNIADTQIWALVAKYLREHPESWNQHTLMMVNAALQQFAPCPAHK